jgi:hypothetical protein
MVKMTITSISFVCEALKNWSAFHQKNEKNLTQP